MIKLNTISDLLYDIESELLFFLAKHNLGVVGVGYGGNEDLISISTSLPKLDFNRLIKTQFDLSEKAFDVIINDGKVRYGFTTSLTFEDYGDRVIDIFLQNLESSGKYVKTIIDEFPSVVYSVEDDDMGGELREELLKLNLK